MPKYSSSSALVTHGGAQVCLRVGDHQFQISHDELRDLLKLPATKTLGLGITIDKDTFQFEFAEGDVAEISASQLHQRLTRGVLARASTSR